MTRYGPQFGPDFTFLGVPECDLDDESSYADADVVILGAPFDGGRWYLIPRGCPFRAAGDQDDRLPATRRVAALTGAADRRVAGPQGL